MKNKANRHPVKRLFVLGAGASYAASKRRQPSTSATPLDRDFCSRIHELNPGRPKWVADARTRMEQQWKDHRRLVDIGLEDAVLRQLGHLEFVEAVHPRRGKGAITATEWLSLVSHLVCYVLEHTSESDGGVYRKFAENVFPAAADVGSYPDRVITFNYDDLLDKHLLGRIDAGVVYFDRIQKSRDSKPGNATYQHPLLLKLHGSVNWRCEQDDFEGLLNGFAEVPHRIQDVWIGARTPSPTDGTYPLIIPPLPVKPLIQVSLFKFLWAKAYEYLHEAEEIVICGYSLPAADRLASSMFSNFSNSALREVTIIDPDPEAIRRWRSLLDRKNVARARWTYFDDFAEYVQRTMVVSSAAAAATTPGGVPSCAGVLDSGTSYG